MPHPSLAGLTVAEVCPYACNLCDERCSSPLDLETEPSLSADFLAAYRDKPVNHTCVAHLWIDAVRPTLRTPQTEMLARTTLATALMSVLENTRLILSVARNPAGLACRADLIYRSGRWSRSGSHRRSPAPRARLHWAICHLQCRTGRLKPSPRLESSLKPHYNPPITCKPDAP